MPCRNLINAKWKVGGNFSAAHKKFVKFDNVLPGLYVKIDYGTCDIEGWELRAYFKKPGWVENDACLLLSATVSNNEATFDLKGTLFGQYGIWEVELVLVGLGTVPDKESEGTTNTISYEVVKNCEGLEVPPIPPEDTCNTVDELIQALRDIIDEGNLANTTWNATITAGNTANDNWNLTITAGNNAQTQWNITIAAGNAANLVWLQTIADGEVLKIEIEALIAGGDLIQKGAGFDDLKYPFLKDVTNDLEEKIYSLGVPGKPLVLAFDPKNRNIENLKHGIYNKNNLTNGDGTVRGEDADSMAVVFNDVDGNVYCGEGYENLWSDIYKLTQSNLFSGATATITESEKFQNFDGTGGSSELVLLGSAITIASNFYYSVKVRNNGINQIEVKGNTFAVSGGVIMAGETKEIKLLDTVIAGSIHLQIVTENVGDQFNFDIWYEKSLVESTVFLPFVKDAAPDGKLIIKEGWTSETHSFIYVGVKYIESVSGISYLHTCVDVGGNVTVSIERSSLTNFESGIYDIIGNSSIGFISMDRSDQTERTSTISSSGLNPNNLISLGISSDDRTFDSIETTFIYYDEGNKLTEQELRNELEKIKSGKYYIENTGVFEPLQGAKKRCNEYGQTKDYVMLGSQSTDIQLVETNKKVYTTAYDGTVRIDRVDNAGVITNISGGAGIENVGGYIRLTVATSPSASTKVKVVIEIVE